VHLRRWQPNDPLATHKICSFGENTLTCYWPGWCWFEVVVDTSGPQCDRVTGDCYARCPHVPGVGVRCQPDPGPPKEPPGPDSIDPSWLDDAVDYNHGTDHDRLQQDVCPKGDCCKHDAIPPIDVAAIDEVSACLAEARIVCNFDPYFCAYALEDCDAATTRRLDELTCSERADTCWMAADLQCTATPELCGVARVDDCNAIKCEK